MTKENKVTEDQLVEYCTKGKPTKYKKEKHVPLLARTFYKGDSVRQFCAQALISKKTFYNWINKHKEFKHTYEVTLNFAADFWERIPFENPEFNYPYLQAVLRTRFGFGKSNINLKDKQSPLEIIEVIQEGIANQTINIQDIKALNDLAQVKQQLLTNSDSEQQEAKRYTPEQWLEMSEKILAASDVVEKAFGGKKVNEQN